MRTRLRVLPRSVVLALLLGASLATDRVHAATPRPACAGACSQIKHIVIMVKENRTFDSMFGTFPHADGATTYIDLNGSRHSLGHEPDSLAYDIGHGETSGFFSSYSMPKMQESEDLPPGGKNVGGIAFDIPVRRDTYMILWKACKAAKWLPVAKVAVGPGHKPIVSPSS